MDVVYAYCEHHNTEKIYRRYKKYWNSLSDNSIEYWNSLSDNSIGMHWYAGYPITEWRNYSLCIIT